jgi:hypothetical protein
MVRLEAGATVEARLGIVLRAELERRSDCKQ